VRYLRKHVDAETELLLGNQSIEKKFHWSLQLFLLVPILCWGWGFASRVYQSVHGHPLFWLEECHAIFSISQGFVNSLVYGFSPKLRATWKEFFSNMQNKKYQSSTEFADGNTN